MIQDTRGYRIGQRQSTVQGRAQGKTSKDKCIGQHSRGLDRVGHRAASRHGGAQSRRRHRTEQDIGNGRK